MWNIVSIVVCVISIVFSVLFLPFSITCLILLATTGLVVKHELHWSVNLTQLQFWLKSIFESIMDRNNSDSKSRLRVLNTNGITKSQSPLLSNKICSNSNLTPQSKFVNEPFISDIYKMSLSDFNNHSTPKSVSGDRNHKYDTISEGRNSWSGNMKSNEVQSEPTQRNVQSVAGPLLVSTRFNSNISSELLANASSAGFYSRLAQKGNEMATHQTKYVGIGVFPCVQLQSRSPKHSISARSTPASSKAVRVRIAPPDNSPLCGFDPAGYSNSSEGDESVKSVLQVLKEISRKRIHSQVEEDGDGKVKRPKKESLDENLSKSLDQGAQNKRVREDSPRSSEEVKRQRRHVNGTAKSNEIMSSLSSSLSVKPPHLVKGTKRKAHAVDWSRCSTPVSGKVLKVNTSPYQDPDGPSKPQENAAKHENEDAQMQDAAARSTQDRVVDAEMHCSSDKRLSNNCVRIEPGTRRLLARAGADGACKDIPVHGHDINDANVASDASELTPAILSSRSAAKKLNDPGKRLKDMLAAINGTDDVSTEETSMSPNVIAILKSAKSCSNDTVANCNDGTRSLSSSLKTPINNGILKSVSFAKPLATFSEFGAHNSSSSSTQFSPTSLSTATVVSTSLNSYISSSEVTTNFSTSSPSVSSNETSSKLNAIQESTSSSNSLPSAVASSNAVTSSPSSLPGVSLESKSNPYVISSVVSSPLISKNVESGENLAQSSAGFGLNTFNNKSDFADSKDSGNSDKPVSSPQNHPVFGMPQSSKDSSINSAPFTIGSGVASAPAASSSSSSSFSTTTEKTNTPLAFSTSNQKAFTFGSSSSSVAFGTSSSPKSTQSSASTTQPTLFSSNSVVASVSHGNAIASAQLSFFNAPQNSNANANATITTKNSPLDKPDSGKNMQSTAGTSSPSVFGNKTLFGAPNTGIFGASSSNTAVTNSNALPATTLFGAKQPNDKVDAPKATASTNAAFTTMFGANSTNAPAFGSSNSFGTASPFASSNLSSSTSSFVAATSSSSSAGFGGSKQDALFGGAVAPNGAGASTTTFGASAANPSSADTSLFPAKTFTSFASPTMSSPSFGTASGSGGNAPATTINSVVGFAAASSNVFGNAHAPSSSNSLFGNVPSSISSSAAFGGNSTGTALGNAPTVTFNASSGFGNNTQAKSFASPVKTTSSSSSLFSFGASQSTPQNSVLNGASTAPSNGSFGAFAAASSSGISSAAPSTVLGGSQLEAKSSGFGSSFQAAVAAPSAFSFGSQAAAASPSGSAFTFGASTSSSNNNNMSNSNPAASTEGFSFTSKATDLKPFTFGGSQLSAPSQQSAFSFTQNNNNSNGISSGANITSPQAGFQFNAPSTAAQPQAPGPFVFGSAGSSTSGSTFGMNQPAFQLGAAAGGGGAMGARFSIGSGSTTARSRTAARSKRTK